MSKIHGFSLVELLVAILVLAVGLTGLAGMQIVGIRHNLSAYHRSIATQLAYDMADRMRSNPVGAASHLYQSLGPDTNAKLCESLTKACTPAELTAYDLKRWNDDLAAKLPAGKGIVCLDSIPDIGDSTGDPSTHCDGQGKVYAIKVWWDDDRSGTTTQGFVTSFQLEGE